MHCTACKELVLSNSVGICMSCQLGFYGIPQEDSYKLILQRERSKIRNLEARAEEIEKELEDKSEDMPKQKKKSKRESIKADREAKKISLEHQLKKSQERKKRKKYKEH